MFIYTISSNPTHKPHLFSLLRGVVRRSLTSSQPHSDIFEAVEIKTIKTFSTIPTGKEERVGI